MSRDTAGLPERLRASGATDLERRLLEATANEQPSPELSERIAQGIGISAAAIGAAASGTALGTGVAAPKAAAGSTALLPWISVGVLGLVVAGAVVGTRAWRTSVRQERPASPAVSAVVPPPTATAPVEFAPAAVAESSPSVTATAPTHRRPVAAATSDLRDQILMVDAARAALVAGAGERALELLRHYQDRYPAGSFRPEAAALKVEALTKLGRNAEARVLAERFVAEYGKIPLADRVARVAGLARP
jgi:hypothetical protein